MKRAHLMKQLRRHAKALGREMVLTEGASHTKVVIGEARTVVPRHREINELTATAILRQMGVLK
jgi:mRNA interferase HicA